MLVRGTEAVYLGCRDCLSAAALHLLHTLIVAKAIDCGTYISILFILSLRFPRFLTSMTSETLKGFLCSVAPVR